MGRHDELSLGAVAQFDDWAQDLGDDVAGLAQYDGVTDEHPLAFDLEAVVQGGHLHGGSGDRHGFHHPEGRHPAGAPHVHLDVEQPGVDLLGWVLVGDGPARCP